MIGAVQNALHGLGMTLSAFTSLATYQREAKDGTVTGGPVNAFARGLRGEELIAAAQQFNHFIQIRASELQALGLYPPRRFDRVLIDSRSYSVEDWRPAPSIGAPIFVKLSVRGP